MRPFLVLLALAFALALPLAALATDAPPPTVVAACQAEYAQIGADAFKTKYGATEPFGHCYQAHAPAVTTTTATTTTTSADDPAAAACKTKDGASEARGNCLKPQTDTKPASNNSEQPKPSDSHGVDGAASVASAFCKAASKTLGRAAFLAKYGPRAAMGNCVKATLATAKSLVASCKASSGSSKDAFKACIAAGVGVQPRRR